MAWDDISDVIAVYGLILGLVVVALLRPARARPIPARVVPGDGVCTDDGTSGVVVRLEHGAALVQIDDTTAVWADASQLMSADPGEVHVTAPPPADPDDIEPLDARSSRDELPALDAFPVPATIEGDGGFLARLASGVFTARSAIAVCWLLIVLTCMPLAGTAEKSFTAGGYTPPGETLDVIADMNNIFGLPLARLQVIVPGTPAEAQAKIDESIRTLYRVPHVMLVSTPTASTDGELTTFTVYFDVIDETVVDSFVPLRDALEEVGFEPEETQIAGTPAFYADIGEQTKRDLAKAEAIGIPLALIVLLFAFGTGVAAIVPLLIGLSTVIVTLAILHLLSMPLNLSIYVMNIASLLGLGLGIDYSLLGVSRFRAELAAGATRRDAITTTVTSAGRAASISGLAVMVGMGALALIPIKVMMSMAVAGIVVVIVSVIMTLTLLPALLALLGPRIERLPVRRQRAADETGGFWYRAAHGVMRRPGISIVVGLLILLALAAPLRNVTLGVPHDDVLPASSPARTASATLEERFGMVVSSPLIVAMNSSDPVKIAQLRAELAKVPNVQSTSVLAVSPRADASLVSAEPIEGKLGGPIQREMAATAEEMITPPKHTNLRFAGQGPGETEFIEAIQSGIPRTLALVFTSTFIILLIAFRSVALPIKAIILDTLSIAASIGVVVAVFQLGHGVSLLGATQMTYTESTIPIILFCVLFGLSMDYEVFMLARISELYQQGYGNREATARGVAGTAPLVTGAALILIVLGLAFATTQIVLVKQIGFGMAVSLFLDATIVRLLLLPATMRLLGDINWWMPRFLQRRIPRMNWAH